MSTSESRKPNLAGTDRTVLGIELLRVGIGVVWALNLIFVVDPANDWFNPASFSGPAATFGSSTVGGPGLANFVAANPTVFAWGVALLTAYLAVAFLLGLTTRLACLVGAATAVAFLWTQWGTIWVIPGGTDVGPHPLYLIIYVALFTAQAGRRFSLDAWVWRSSRSRFPRAARWLAAP